ncbi:probable LRR receptor-like serine/threonine-protein kinase At4g36180 [Trifolium pratense]|uniref:probable LRR receptor-like serine/threonine-protein kinase At4g36180 n=1 Tax=Trifolium pratense TaxID=57577 RepID=UPI001E696EAB|nr:probable LRR receptor-like serine/threonine-protein kinase At4g36180 [Trifolium pratense]
MDGVDLSSVARTDWVSALNQLPSLMKLHLSSCKLFGQIPSPSSLNFTSVVDLDLSSNSFISKIPDWLVNISTLQHIGISRNDLYGEIPLRLRDLPKLQYLNLGYNHNLSASCSQLFMKGWKNMRALRLSHNKLHGRLHSSFGNLTSLTYLDFSYNAIDGGIPSSIGKLCRLKFFDLSGNNMTGTLPEFLQGIDECPSRKLLPKLASFIMSNNQLHGKIPDWLGRLDNLVKISLAHNLLEGPIPVSIGSLQNLTTLTLTDNILNGTLPDSLGQLSKLTYLDVSFNQLTGMVTEDHFLMLTKLVVLKLSSNSLTLNVSANWIPPFQVSHLRMGSCVLGPSFPLWLKSQNKLHNIDFSNASIFGFIPIWLWDITSNSRFLNMSHNELQGWLPNPIHVGYSSHAIDLSFNLLERTVPIITPEIELSDLSHNCFSGAIQLNIGQHMNIAGFLSLSHNQLHGEIPLSLGEMSHVTVIDLSGNNLTGRIPPSLANCSFLSVLDLGNNSLFGTIPNSLGQLKHLRSLHLNDNHFSGDLPLSLRNLSLLETMDLRNNRLSGSLQVLDLSKNDLSGSIPASLGDLKAIAHAPMKNRYILYGNYTGHYYEESLNVYVKDQRLKYTFIPLLLA